MSPRGGGGGILARLTPEGVQTVLLRKLLAVCNKTLERRTNIYDMLTPKRGKQTKYGGHFEK